MANKAPEIKVALAYYESGETKTSAARKAGITLRTLNSALKRIEDTAIEKISEDPALLSVYQRAMKAHVLVVESIITKAIKLVNNTNSEEEGTDTSFEGLFNVESRLERITDRYAKKLKIEEAPPADTPDLEAAKAYLKKLKTINGKGPNLRRGTAVITQTKFEYKEDAPDEDDEDIIEGKLLD